MPDNGRVVAVYSAHTAAENAIQQLRKTGYDITKLSIVVKDYHIEQRVVGFYTTGDRIRRWGESGVLWGCTIGLMYAAALLVIPDMGAGARGVSLAFFIQSAVGGAAFVGALSAIGAGLYSMALRKDSVLKYEVLLKTDDEFLLLAAGEEDAAAARDIVWTPRTVGLGGNSSEPLDTRGSAGMGPQIA